MITEYMQSGSLFDLIHKKDTLKFTEERIFSICEDIALGMNYLHSRKVMHCDLKSSNVLVNNKICYKIFKIFKKNQNNKLKIKKI